MNVRTIGIAVIVVALVAAFTGIVSAVPDGATVTQSNNETQAEVVGGTADAMGGNISQVNLEVSQQTAKWQGYYGIVSGEIVLAGTTDTMFAWSITNRTGEVYATPNSTIPIWANYYTNDAATNNVNIAFNLGTGSGVNDNATDTFTETAHTAFNLSGNVVPAATGPCAKTLDDTPSAIWETVILTDNDGGSTVNDFLFVGLMQENKNNFAGSACDYQMIVPDNPEDTAATTYYFYVELS